MNLKESNKYGDISNIAILLTIALSIGIYLILTTTIIAKDGITFIEYAKGLDIDPTGTILKSHQHPGYPWTILVAYKITAGLHENQSLSSWIYCGQSVTLLFRIIAIVILYFIAKKLFGSRVGFWSVVILLILPKPTQYGSDVLSDWPNLCMVMAGLFLLIKATTEKKIWLFAFIGLVSGLGYLIRPESVQLVVLGGMWLGFQIVWPKRIMSKSKALIAVCLLFAGFIAISAPYMKAKGSLFPKKNFGIFSQKIDMPQTVQCKPQIAGFNVAPFVKLSENICETLMWFFVPAMLIGMYTWFRTHKWHEPQAFFIIAVVLLNIFLVTCLHYKYNYMSQRHTLVLLIFPILFVPVGLQKVAAWCAKGKKGFSTKREESTWFLVLFLIGLSICTPKLLQPLRTEKKGYKAAAMWFKANTDSTAVIAASDKRVRFYAERIGVDYDGQNLPANADYIVQIVKNLGGNVIDDSLIVKASFDLNEGEKKLFILQEKTD